MVMKNIIAEDMPFTKSIFEQFWRSYCKKTIFVVFHFLKFLPINFKFTNDRIFRSAFFLNRFDNLFWTFSSSNLHKCHLIPSDNTNSPFSPNIFRLTSDFLIAAKPEASPDLGRSPCYRKARAQVGVEQCSQRTVQKKLFVQFFLIHHHGLPSLCQRNKSQYISFGTEFVDCLLKFSAVPSDFSKFLQKGFEGWPPEFPFCRLRVLSTMKTDLSWME